MAVQTDFSLDQYLKEILKDAEGTLPKEKVEAARELLAHEKVAPRVKELALTRSDYSRNMDKLRSEERALQEKLAETERFYQTQILADHNNREAFSQLQAENQRLQQQMQGQPYGQPLGEPQMAQPSGITKEEYAAQMEQLQKNALSVMTKMNYLSSKHLKEFDEVLDPSEVVKLAVEKSLPLDVAYDSYTAELRQKRADERHQDELKKAREEGAMEYASKHNLPLVDTRPRGIHPLLTKQDEVPRTHNDRVAAATEAYLRGEK